MDSNQEAVDNMRKRVSIFFTVHHINKLYFSSQCIEVYEECRNCKASS